MCLAILHAPSFHRDERLLYAPTEQPTTGAGHLPTMNPGTIAGTGESINGAP